MSGRNVPSSTADTAHGPRVVSGIQTPAADSTGPAALSLEKRIYQHAKDCVHCGLCLSACPTYTQTLLETDSPRGRIHLLKGLADRRIDPSAAVLRHLDLCLDCRACETACPSGVVYHELIEESRHLMAPVRPRTLGQRVVRAMVLGVFPNPLWMKLLLLPARLVQKLGLWKLLTHRCVTAALPRPLRAMSQMLPATGPVWPRRLRKFYPAKAPDGVKRATVGLFAGCIGSVLQQDVNRQSIELLQHIGCDVVVPRAQRCCGAIDHHNDRPRRAAELAQANIAAFLEGAGQDVDHITTNVAGCGAVLREYGELLRDDETWRARAVAFAAKVRDITELLVALDPPRPRHAIRKTATYHDACHLRHAQGVADPPRRVLGWIAGLKLVPLEESEICCGAAGTYHLSQPDMSRQLADRKIAHIQSTGCETCVTGNIGCALQIEAAADRLGAPLQVAHPVTLLHMAYFGDRDGGKRRPA